MDYISMNIATLPKDCKTLLHEYRMQEKKCESSKLKFKGITKDVYNITAPFEVDNVKYIAGRVEDRDSEIAQVMFFKKEEDSWVRAYDNVLFNRFQDPFVTKVNDEIIIGGVHAITDPLDDSKFINWVTLFYRGKTLDKLELFAIGPNKMKDVRIVQLNNGKIGVFTRPQGGIFGMGKIGFTLIDSLDDLNSEVIEKALVFDTHFISGEWGGVNEIHPLENGKLGVLGHIAYWVDGIRHYYSMSFIFDYETMKHSPVKIIACRNDFEEGPYKRIDLQDVLFSGGLIRKEDGTAELFTGVSDAEAHMLKIEDPFIMED